MVKAVNCFIRPTWWFKSCTKLSRTVRVLRVLLPIRFCSDPSYISSSVGPTTPPVNPVPAADVSSSREGQTETGCFTCCLNSFNMVLKHASHCQLRLESGNRPMMDLISSQALNSLMIREFKPQDAKLRITRMFIAHKKIHVQNLQRLQQYYKREICETLQSEMKCLCVLCLFRTARRTSAEKGDWHPARFMPF